MIKPVGYHWDLFIVGILSGLFGLLGVPWICAASVRSYQHLQALSVFTKHNAPGEKPKLVKVHEQRVTNIVIHCLISELVESGELVSPVVPHTIAKLANGYNLFSLTRFCHCSVYNLLFQ